MIAWVYELEGFGLAALTLLLILGLSWLLGRGDDR
jgi:hypothetical protein